MFVGLGSKIREYLRDLVPWTQRYDGARLQNSRTQPFYCCNTILLYCWISMVRIYDKGFRKLKEIHLQAAKIEFSAEKTDLHWLYITFESVFCILFFETFAHIKLFYNIRIMRRKLLRRPQEIMTAKNAVKIVKQLFKS